MRFRNVQIYVITVEIKTAVKRVSRVPDADKILAVYHEIRRQAKVSVLQLLNIGTSRKIKTCIVFRSTFAAENSGQRNQIFFLAHDKRIAEICTAVIRSGTSGFYAYRYRIRNLESLDRGFVCRPVYGHGLKNTVLIDDRNGDLCTHGRGISVLCFFYLRTADVYRHTVRFRDHDICRRRIGFRKKEQNSEKKRRKQYKRRNHQRYFSVTHIRHFRFSFCLIQPIENTVPSGFTPDIFVFSSSISAKAVTLHIPEV